MEHILAIPVSAALISLSALFSGLTLGLLSLDVHDLKRQADLGDKGAQRIYNIRKKGNLLLTTLLLGNVTVNTTLSVFLGSLVSGIIAGFAATGLIFLLGEIIPQAVVSRHAIWFGSRTTWIVRIFIFVFYPVAFPIAYALDKALGEELPTIYTKHELMRIISEHEDSDESTIDQDEERIIHGALQFSHTHVREVMTLKEKVVMFDEHKRLTQDFFETVQESGFSRYPVYSGNTSNIVGILYAKGLLTEDENVSIIETEEAFEKTFLSARPGEYLDTVLARMLKEKQHMCIVMSKQKEFLGVITLEDIIEEIIQHEIEDEEDAEDTLLA